MSFKFNRQTQNGTTLVQWTPFLKTDPPAHVKWPDFTPKMLQDLIATAKCDGGKTTELRFYKTGNSSALRVALFEQSLFENELGSIQLIRQSSSFEMYEKCCRDANHPIRFESVNAGDFVNRHFYDKVLSQLSDDLSWTIVIRLNENTTHLVFH